MLIIYYIIYIYRGASKSVKFSGVSAFQVFQVTSAFWTISLRPLGSHRANGKSYLIRNHGHRHRGLANHVHKKAHANTVLCRIELVNWQCNDLDKDFATQNHHFGIGEFFCGYLRFFAICVGFFAGKVRCFFSHLRSPTWVKGAKSHIWGKTFRARISPR